jgi:hypothetical protein
MRVMRCSKPKISLSRPRIAFHERSHDFVRGNDRRFEAGYLSLDAVEARLDALKVF